MNVWTKRLLYMGCCFAAPIGVFLLGLCISGVYPFGNTSFLTEDLKIQYIDFFSWYRGVLLGQGNLFYSFGQSLGDNTWGLYSYYLASPVNLLVVFFDTDHLTDFVVFADAVKLGFAGVAAALYLRRRFSLSYVLSFALALSWAVSLYVVTNLRNPLWLDAIAVLPIVMLGLYRYVHDGKTALLVGSLAFQICVNWYMGYMTVVFVFVMYLLERANLIDSCSRPTVSGNAHRAVSFFNNILFCHEARLSFLRLCACIALAVVLSAWTFVPTLATFADEWSTKLSVLAVIVLLATFIAALAVLRRNLSRRWSLVLVLLLCTAVVGAIAVVAAVALTTGKAGNASLLSTTTTLLCVVKSVFSAQWSNNVLAQLFPGYVVLQCVCFFFLQHKLSDATSKTAAVVLLFMLASVYSMALYAMWCGFRVPSGFYCRIAWLFVFVMLWLGGSALQRAEERRSSFSARVGFVMAFAVALAVTWGSDGLGAFQAAIAGTETLISGCALLLAFTNRSSQRARIIGTGLIVAMAFTGSLTAFVSNASSLYCSYSQSYHNEYVSSVRSQAQELQAFDSSAYRVDKTYTRVGDTARNESQTLGLKSLSSYSSAVDQYSVAFLQMLGYSNENSATSRKIVYRAPLLPSDSLLGVKYVSALSQPALYEDCGLSADVTGGRFYCNPYALAVGYGASDTVLDAALDPSNDAFQNQNAFISAVLGSDQPVFKQLSATCDYDDGTTKTWSYSAPANTLSYARVDGMLSKHIYKTILDVSADGLPVFSQNWFTGSSAFPIGTVAADDAPHSVSATIEGGKTDWESTQDLDCQVYALDLDRFNDAVAQIKSHQFVPTTFEDGHIEGTYQTDRNGYLLMTVPYDYGWSVTVNGRSVDPVPVFGGALMVLPVDAGSNDIQMSYLSPGFTEGVAISFISAVVLLVCFIRSKNGSRR